MNFKRVKIITTIPSEYADKIREALGKAGAGIRGEYSFCSFTMLGVGCFKPSDKANPLIGERGKMEQVEEERIEVICDYSNVKSAIAALRKAHPYEEPAIDIMPLLDEEDL